MAGDLLERVSRLLSTPDPDSRPLIGLLSREQPYDLAVLLSELDDESQLRLVSLLPTEMATAVIDELDHDHQYRLLDHLDESIARPILATMSDDVLADLLRSIHPRQAREILQRVPTETVDKIRRLMSYPEHSAGGRMTESYIGVRQNWTIRQVLAHFRKVGREVEVAHNVYVVDGHGHLVGVASLRDIVLAAPDATVAGVMSPQAIAVHVLADQEEAAELLGQYDFVALPVVDDEGRLVGVITADDIIDVFTEEATEDIQRLGGSQPFTQPYLQVSFLELFRKRIGWLLVLFLAESITGTIMSHHESMLNRFVALAFFVPLLIGTAGNAGSQASTLVIRAMALGEVQLRDFLTVLWRESRVGLALGVTLGLISYFRAMMLGSSPALGFTVAATITLVVVLSSAVGAVLPIIGRRFGIDPAVFSAPLITTLADTVGLLIYFYVARLILGFTV